MTLKLVSLATALALAAVSLTPAFAATTTTTTTTTAKPAMMAAKPAKTTTPDPKRFATEAAAAAACPTDTVVWANTKSKIYHLTGTATFGKGKNGVYMCTADATGEGFKPTKKPEKVMATTTSTTTTTTTKTK